MESTIYREGVPRSGEGVDFSPVKVEDPRESGGDSQRPEGFVKLEKFLNLVLWVFPCIPRKYCWNIWLYFYIVNIYQPNKQQNMKLLKIIWLVTWSLLLAWCEINLQFKSDGAILNNAIERVAYLYNNCMSDIEWIEEVMTPETMQNMTETCKASIKTMNKIRTSVEKLKNKVWDNQAVTLILSKINTAISTLESGTTKITSIYNDLENWESPIDFENKYNEILTDMKKENIVEVLWNIQNNLSNL